MEIVSPSGGGFARGGPTGGTVNLRMLPEVRPAVGGEPLVIYADECFISSDGLCRRPDTFHRAVSISTERPWICLAHD